MANEVTLGGDRLGSGNKQKVELHNYQMTSFNLEQDWKSSMAPGILYPFLKLVGTPHDTFDIDLEELVRTVPTKGPLMGSYKLQIDIFNCPIRLYQGILHNNPIDIGLKMNQVYLPKIKFKSNSKLTIKGTDEYNSQISESSLLKYLGFSGAGLEANEEQLTVTRKINAVPVLAYYDIFKNYYSNKQETNAYVIVPTNIRTEPKVKSFGIKIGEQWYESNNNEYIDITLPTTNPKAAFPTIANGNNLKDEDIYVVVEYNDGQNTETATLKELREDWDVITSYEKTKTYIQFSVRYNDWLPSVETDIKLLITDNPNVAEYTSDIHLQPFELANIDKMRNRLLSANTLGEEFVIDEYEGDYPYRAIAAIDSATGKNLNAYMQNGLVVKTYQSDLFNNWLDTEWIDGENGISALSAVSITDNKFTMDSLNLAEKVYEVLNRIAVSGGTYEDWQEAVWGQGAIRKAETPMYMGGMAAEIYFEEVVSTSEATINGETSPLGTLGGRGKTIGNRGGHDIHIKCEEPSYIMGIVSITPRICYSQGNDWDLTELDTLDDLHKPALDGIGFQDLMVEQMAWWDTKIRQDGTVIRNSAGKQTAWINYQTAVDKCYGDFARSGEEGRNFMVLNRNYEYENGEVMDITTYIDPAKYNYAFAYSKLDAQNFWVQIHSKVIARRKMGAQQIPNL